MTSIELKAHAQREDTPDGQWPLAIQALWWDAKGDWERAHGCAQDKAGGSDCDWMHAYLHRKEGDDGNAGYWYARSGKRFCDSSLDSEWSAIAETLLGALS